ncbi:MAG: hypothetical protein ACI83P_000921 [Janthinobacterium sp.]|jgi:hypothetical protein
MPFTAVPQHPVQVKEGGVAMPSIGWGDDDWFDHQVSGPPAALTIAMGCAGGTRFNSTSASKKVQVEQSCNAGPCRMRNF